MRNYNLSSITSIFSTSIWDWSVRHFTNSLRDTDNLKFLSVNHWYILLLLNLILMPSIFKYRRGYDWTESGTVRYREEEREWWHQHLSVSALEVWVTSHI